MANETTLQTFVLPDEARADRTGLYARYPGGPIRLNRDGMTIVPNASIDFATFFNAFSHRKWRERTGLEHLSLRLHGGGRIGVSVTAYTSSTAGFEVAASTVELTPDGVTIDLPVLSQMSGEIIGTRLFGLADDARLTAAAWTTREQPRRAIALAAVVTTFGRQAAIRRTMKTFSSTTCEGTKLGTVDLYVIDNERRLEAAGLDHVTIIPNPNLGGSGGFTRGLIEAIDAGRFSHVLFMDDDAACEPESVWRTMALLAYAKNPALAVAGAMLLTDRPCVQTEKGAYLDTTGVTGSTWRANRPGVDLAQLREVCNNEADSLVNYGAWWFFAFPLARVRSFPFPFFVRGDDVDFSLMNDFDIVTLNGVATWCDGFETKTGPETEYLAYRGWMALALMHGDRNAAFLTLWNTLKLARAMSLRFDYAAMNAILDAVEDAVSGPEIFTRDPAPLAKLSRHKAKRTATPLTQEDFKRLLAQTPTYDPFRRKSLRAGTTMFGHHLATLSEQHVRHAQTPWNFGDTPLLDSEMTAYGEGTRLFFFKRDRFAFFRGKLRSTKVLWLSRFRLTTARRRYRAQGDAIRSRAFWEPLLRGPGSR